MGSRITWQKQMSLAAGSLTSNYLPLSDGTNSLLVSPARQFFIQNLTEADIQVSFDGINAAFPIVSRGYFVSDITTNTKAFHDDGPMIAKGTGIFVKILSGTPTTGAVYFSYWSENKE